MAREQSGSPVERYVSLHVHLPAGGVLVVLHADARAWLPALAKRCTDATVFATHRRLPVVQALQRDLDLLGATNVTVLHAQGTSALPDALAADVVVIRLPTEKIGLQQLLFDAVHCLRDGGTCLVYGGTNEGIKSAARTMQSVFGQARVLAHSGGHRVLAATLTAALDTAGRDALAAPYHDASVFLESMVTLRGATIPVSTRPGVFSWEHLDEASAVLAGVMEIPRAASVLDLGCGSGVLGAVAGVLSDGGAVTLVDADSEAVRCATRTMQSTGITSWRVLASDVTSAVQGESFDVVLCNPPFHTGKATDLALPIRFIEEAYSVIRSGGRLMLVANRTLPYEQEFERVFGNRRTVHDGARFKVLEATRR